MRSERLDALNGRQKAPSLREEVHEIKGLLKDILSELKAINGTDVDVEKARAEFYSDAHHFDGGGNYRTMPESAYNIFRANFPTYFTDNPAEVDRNDPV